MKLHALEMPRKCYVYVAARVGPARRELPETKNISSVLPLFIGVESHGSSINIIGRSMLISFPVASYVEVILWPQAEPNHAVTVSCEARNRGKSLKRD